MSATDKGFRPLAGLRVLELGDGIAGASATAMLASFGATVTSAINADSPLRTSPPLIATMDSGERSVLSVLLDRDKTIERSKGLPAIDEFDLVVCDRVGGPVTDLPADVDEYLAMVETFNPGVWVTVSGFGLVGPRRAESATDFVIAAAGGVLSVVLDPETDRPVEMAGSQMLLSAGHVAALAACHGLSRLSADAEPVHADVSAQAVAVATGPVMKVLGLLLNSAAVSSGRKYGAPAAFYPCRDGLLRISALEDHQWRGVTEAFDRPDWLERFPTPVDRIDGVDEIDALITELTLPLGKADCEAMLQATGVPAAAMYGPAELLESEQFADRSAFESQTVAAGEISFLDRPFRVDGHVPQPTGLLTGRETGTSADQFGGVEGGLSGLRVAEVGHVLAVPLAGSLLGAMGADVVKLEDTGRVDIFRRKAPYVDDEPGLERAVYFSMVNHSKRSAALAFEEDSEALRKLIDRSEVVIENYGPSRAHKLGLDGAALANHPDLVVVSSSAYGHHGPWSRYRAYAYNIHTGSGLLALTRTPSGEPAQLAMAWADVITGYFIATLVAAWAVGDRDGAVLDISMAELIGARFNEFLAAESAGIAYSVGGDSSSRILDGTDAMVAASVSTAEQRELVDRLESADASAADLVIELQRGGIAAAAVVDASGLIADEQLLAFGLFAEVEHFEWGRRRMVGLPWRFVGEPTIVLGAPPCFGSATDESGVVGLALWPNESPEGS